MRSFVMRLHDLHDLLALHPGFRGEFFKCAAHHVEIHVGERTEAAALDEDGLLIEHLGGLEHLAARAEHCRAAQAELDELQRHEPVVHASELDAGKFDHVDLDAARVQVIQQIFDEPLRLVMQEKAAVAEIHTDDTERLLLCLRVGVEHAHMDDDLTRFVARVALKFHAHPAVAFVGALEIAGRDCVCECEKRRIVAAQIGEPLKVQRELVVEHRLEPRA
jgi:hypothetical protein